MLRRFVTPLMILALVVFGLNAQDKDKDKGKAKGKGQKATITKVDAKENSITLKFKGKGGKEIERTFKLQSDVKMYDEAGKVITIDAYRVGGGVVVIQREGRILEVHKDKGSKGKDTREKDKK